MNTWIVSGSVIDVEEPNQYGLRMVVRDEAGDPRYRPEVVCDVGKKQGALIETALSLRPGAVVVVSGYIRGGKSKEGGRRFNALAVRDIEVITAGDGVMREPAGSPAATAEPTPAEPSAPPTNGQPAKGGDPYAWKF